MSCNLPLPNEEMISGSQVIIVDIPESTRKPVYGFPESILGTSKCSPDILYMPVTKVNKVHTKIAVYAINNTLYVTPKHGTAA